MDSRLQPPRITFQQCARDSPPVQGRGRPPWSAQHSGGLPAFWSSGFWSPNPVPSQCLLVPAVGPAATNIPFNQWCLKMDVVQSATARPESMGYF